jgi:para-aminobenzoate synthetase component 1
VDQGHGIRTVFDQVLARCDIEVAIGDLGRVSRFGKVDVSEFMSVEKYSHVMHIVSEVSARLASNKDIYDALRAAFPLAH